MKILRTPDDRFANLTGYPFAPHYVVTNGLRIHYIDEGNPKAAPVLMMHGEPSWSYLYRKMIPIIVQAGHRAVAPDLVGFGKSDKPASIDDYSYQRHVDWMAQWLQKLDLKKITLVCQDWGSLIGLRLAAEHEERFDRIVLANGGLPTGDRPGPMAFRVWKNFAIHSPWFPIGKIVSTGCATRLNANVTAAYDAPFPDDSYKQGARAFPRLVPVTPDDPAVQANNAAWEVFRKWQKPFVMAFSDRDPITRGIDKVFRKRVPGAASQQHTTIKGAGHFLQEDKGEELAQFVVDFINKTTEIAENTENASL